MNVGDEIKLLLLQRAHGGHITERFCAYYDDGVRVWYWAVHAVAGLFVARWAELLYPPESPARQLKFVPRGLVPCAELGLTEADVTRRLVLTERGVQELKSLSERQQASSAVVDQ